MHIVILKYSFMKLVPKHYYLLLCNFLFDDNSWKIMTCVYKELAINNRCEICLAFCLYLYMSVVNGLSK